MGATWFKGRRNKAGSNNQDQANRLRQDINRFHGAVVTCWELQEKARQLPENERKGLAEMINSQLRETADAWSAIATESRRFSDELQMRLQALAELAAMDPDKANLIRRTKAMARFTQKLLEQVEKEAASKSKP
ncbi:MAG TPA: hypothetical protein VGK99_11920 [Acidobacteriota bacterium]|jgi:undecaprenyl pyrophosphate synthase